METRNKPKTNNIEIVNASLKNLPITPRKVRLVAKAVVNKSISDAISILENTNKRCSLPLLKLLNSAIANATNNKKWDLNHLKIDNIIVNEGMKLKRFRPQARGTAYPIIKRYSHINIILANTQSVQMPTNENIAMKGGSK